ADEEILAAIPEMARATGVFAEPAASTPWVGLKQMVGNKKVCEDELVVCIVTGSGLKDIANAQSTVNQPQLIEPTLEAVLACETV
ncbi:MAG: threonine synthase, partial [Gammaproteobacteria bacterium]|nr:threonine synthase [Gammaproteobacteria bacterium]